MNAASKGIGTRTVAQLLSGAATARPDDLYLLFGDDSYTLGTTAGRAGGIAANLRALGIGRGDRVVVVLGNEPSFLFALFALAAIGAILVPVNPAATAAELAAALGEADPALVVCTRERFADLREAAGDGAEVVAVEELTDQGPYPSDDSGATSDDVAVMFLTSGTTGAPKLVMQSHRALVLAAEGFPWWLGLQASDRLMTALPLWHINALVYSALGSLDAGAGFVLLPKFSASHFWGQARAYGATQFNVVGAMLEILARRPPSDDDTNPARLCYTALAPATRERHLEIERRFDLTLVAGYGLSECPYGTIWPLDGPRPYGSMGRLKQHPELGVISQARLVSDDGADVPAGTPGELLLRNPAVMTGYFNRPAETAAALRDGWLHTGDLVRLDAGGTYHFVARKKEVIRRRGENVTPGEIEAALESHPAVAEAVVIAVPSDLGEDDIKAFVTGTPGTSPDLEELRDRLGERMAPYKLPRYLEVVDEFPRTPTGRVARRSLPTERTVNEVDFG
jgi:crotonobetaine/carnitine-CoA ligase